MSQFVTGLRCTVCEHHSPEGAHEYACPQCGGITDVEYNYEAIAKVLGPQQLAANPDPTIMRYAPLLPIPEGAPRSPLRVGNTPLYDCPRLAKSLGVARLWLKDDGALPTGSFKDRASFVGTARAAAQGARIIAAASTGNAATSVSGLCASMGLQPYIFVPASAPIAKVAQLCVYGARVFLIEGDYDQTYDFCQEAVARFGWYNRSAAINPYLVEGKKTCGHEIGEALAQDMPTWVSMSVGDGCSIAGTYKGLLEMHKIGVSDRVPKMLGVQAEGAAPLTAAFHQNTEAVERLTANTLADSINVGMPRNPLKALRAVRASQGTYVNVSDAQILEWIPKMAQGSGVFGEPAGTTALAGVYQARQEGLLSADDSVLCVVSGNGLKDIQNAMRAVQAPSPIPPDLQALERALG